MAFHPHANTPPPPFAPFGTPPGFNAPLSGFSTPLGGFNAGLPPLPPGVGLDARGMPFELASGRAVVLQAPVFNPAFVPGHHHQAPISGHHSQTSMSMSGGHAHSMSHSMGGGGLGPELFAFARGARVEIRAPGSAPPPAPPAAAASTPVDAEPKSPTSPKDGKSPQSAQAPKLRTGAAAFVPSSSSASSPGGQGLGYYVPAYDYGSGAGAGHENGNGGAAADYGPGHENGNGGNGYVGTQYYYPYYAGPGQQEQGMGMGHEQGMSMGGQQEALPPMGTVYY
ncbi:hypothetical protein C8R44DRAFT_776418 [Mycena epipterygia]|nr:hypothetical protein C8R44DRAFT_776418 [Mycena epipterygia]